MLYSLPEYTKRLRIDLRKQTVHNETLKRVHLDQKKKIEELTKENKRLKKENGKLKKEKEKLKEEIEKITKTQNRYQVALFDHGNFHHPELKDKKPNGGQIGHEDTNQDKKRDYQSFKRQRLFAANCGNCGKELPRVNGVKEKTLIDIQINTQLIQVILQSERQWCKHCHHEVTAKSTQSLPFSEYGMNTFMMILLMRFKSHQSIEKISTVLSLGFGLTISPSSILSLLRQAKEYLSDKYELLKQAIRDGNVMYNDETGWSVHGQKAWMWIMTNADTTVYVAAESRGKGIFEQMYGNSKAISMHDGYAGYQPVTGIDKTAYCWAHVLRFAYEETVLEKNPTTIACQIRDRLVSLYQNIRANTMWTKEQKDGVLRSELDSLIALPTKDDSSKNIQYRIATQKEGLILSLLVTNDGTNNLAERELRPMAIARTISFGSATYKGMQTSAVLGSIVQTISRNKKQAFLPTLKEHLFTGIQEKYPQYKHPPSFAT
jgi:cell division protein FtsB